MQAGPWMSGNGIGGEHLAAVRSVDGKEPVGVEVDRGRIRLLFEVERDREPMSFHGYLPLATYCYLGD
jgi:hypothetical protein